MVFQKYFNSLIDKYFLLSEIDFDRLRAGKNPVVLDRVPKNLPNHIRKPESFSEILLGDSEMQVLFKKMITQFKIAYQVNGTAKAQFAKTNSSSGDDKLEALYNFLNISKIVKSDNEDVASFIGTNLGFPVPFKRIKLFMGNT